MKTVEVAEAAAYLAEYVRSVEQEPLILTLDGRPVAALVAIDDADLETATLRVHPQFLAIMERSRLRHEREGGISSQEMRRRLGADSGET